MIDDLPDDQPLEVLVWTLARDAKDLRERVQYGVPINGKALTDLFEAACNLELACMWLSKPEAAE